MAVEVGTPIGSPRASTAVTGAIRGAAQATGTSFSYLLATAKIESDLDPTLTTKSSSAAGLFQFIDQTWLGTLKQAGPAFGYGAYLCGRDHAQPLDRPLFRRRSGNTQRDHEIA